MSSPDLPSRSETSDPDSAGSTASAASRRRRAGIWAAATLLLAVIAGATGSLVQQIQGAREEGLLDEAPRHQRQIVRRDGKTLLWARNRPGGDGAEWFDVTGALVDPANFEHGIGKDRIASIDKPAFLRATDRRLRDMGYRDSTVVIGWEHEGEAKAYPIGVLNRHELVNDWVGGKPVTVGW